MKNFVGVVLAVLIPLALLLLLEAVLGIVGVPKDELIRYAHPANFNQHREYVEFEYEFETNSQGLRYKDIPLKRRGEEARVLMLGDSFTEGYGVEADETFGAVMERYLERRNGRPVAFINGGLSGAGPLQYWRMFSVVGHRYDVDGLLICLNSTDLSDTPDVVSQSDLHDFYPRRSGLNKIMHTLFPRTRTLIKRVKTKKPSETPEPTEFVAAVTGEARRLRFSEQRINEWKNKLPPKLVAAVDEGRFNGKILSCGLLTPHLLIESLDLRTGRAERKFRAMTAVLDEIVKKASGVGTEVAVVYIPFVLQYDSTQYEPDIPLIQMGAVVRQEWLTERTEIQKRLDRWTGDKGIPFLDLTPAFREAISDSTGLNFRLDGHWTPSGHRVAARAISGWIERGECFSFIK